MSVFFFKVILEPPILQKSQDFDLFMRDQPNFNLLNGGIPSECLKINLNNNSSLVKNYSALSSDFSLFSDLVSSDFKFLFLFKGSVLCELEAFDSFCYLDFCFRETFQTVKKKIQKCTKIYTTYDMGLLISVLFLIIALLIKIGGFPFHAWVIEVYHKISFPIMALLSTLVKFIFFFLLIYFFCKPFFGYFFLWRYLLFFFICGSFCIGAVGVYLEKNLKKFFAYGSLVHAGYIGFSLASFNSLGICAALLYLFIYIVTISFLFFSFSYFRVFFNVNEFCVGKTSFQTLNDLKRLRYTYPGLAFCLAGVFLSLAGLPPFLGFFGKFYVLYSFYASYHLCFSFFTAEIYLFILAVFISIFSCAYYLKIIKIMFINKWHIYVLKNFKKLLFSKKRIFYIFFFFFFWIFFLFYFIFCYFYLQWVCDFLNTYIYGFLFCEYLTFLHIDEVVYSKTQILKRRFFTCILEEYDNRLMEILQDGAISKFLKQQWRVEYSKFYYEFFLQIRVYDKKNLSSNSLRLHPFHHLRLLEIEKIVIQLGNGVFLAWTPTGMCYLEFHEILLFKKYLIQQFGDVGASFLLSLKPVLNVIATLKGAVMSLFTSISRGIAWFRSDPVKEKNEVFTDPFLELYRQSQQMFFYLAPGAHDFSNKNSGIVTKNTVPWHYYAELLKNTREFTYKKKLTNFFLIHNWNVKGDFAFRSKTCGIGTKYFSFAVPFELKRDRFSFFLSHEYGTGIAAEYRLALRNLRDIVSSKILKSLTHPENVRRSLVTFDHANSRLIVNIGKFLTIKKNVTWSNEFSFDTREIRRYKVPAKLALFLLNKFILKYFIILHDQQMSFFESNERLRFLFLVFYLNFSSVDFNVPISFFQSTLVPSNFSEALEFYFNSLKSDYLGLSKKYLSSILLPYILFKHCDLHYNRLTLDLQKLEVLPYFLRRTLINYDLYHQAKGVQLSQILTLNFLYYDYGLLTNALNFFFSDFLNIFSFTAQDLKLQCILGFLLFKSNTLDLTVFLINSRHFQFFHFLFHLLNQIVVSLLYFLYTIFYSPAFFLNIIFILNEITVILFLFIYNFFYILFIPGLEKFIMLHDLILGLLLFISCFLLLLIDSNFHFFLTDSLSLKEYFDSFNKAYSKILLDLLALTHDLLDIYTFQHRLKKQTFSSLSLPALYKSYDFNLTVMERLFFDPFVYTAVNSGFNPDNLQEFAYSHDSNEARYVNFYQVDNEAKSSSFTQAGEDFVHGIIQFTTTFSKKSGILTNIQEFQVLNPFFPKDAGSGDSLKHLVTQRDEYFDHAIMRNAAARSYFDQLNKAAFYRLNRYGWKNTLRNKVSMAHFTVFEKQYWAKLVTVEGPEPVDRFVLKGDERNYYYMQDGYRPFDIGPKHFWTYYFPDISITPLNLILHSEQRFQSRSFVNSLPGMLPDLAAVSFFLREEIFSNSAKLYLNESKLFYKSRINLSFFLDFIKNGSNQGVYKSPNINASGFFHSVGSSFFDSDAISQLTFYNLFLIQFGDMVPTLIYLISLNTAYFPQVLTLAFFKQGCLITDLVQYIFLSIIFNLQNYFGIFEFGGETIFNYFYNSRTFFLYFLKFYPLFLSILFFFFKLLYCIVLIIPFFVELCYYSLIKADLLTLQLIPTAFMNFMEAIRGPLFIFFLIKLEDYYIDEFKFPGFHIYNQNYYDDIEAEHTSWLSWEFDYLINFHAVEYGGSLEESNEALPLIKKNLKFHRSFILHHGAMFGYTEKLALTQQFPYFLNLNKFANLQHDSATSIYGGAGFMKPFAQQRVRLNATDPYRYNQRLRPISYFNNFSRFLTLDFIYFFNLMEPIYTSYFRLFTLFFYGEKCTVTDSLYLYFLAKLPQGYLISFTVNNIIPLYMLRNLQTTQYYQIYQSKLPLFKFHPFFLARYICLYELISNNECQIHTHYLKLKEKYPNSYYLFSIKDLFNVFELKISNSVLAFRNEMAFTGREENAEAETFVLSCLLDKKTYSHVMDEDAELFQPELALGLLLKMLNVSFDVNTYGLSSASVDAGDHFNIMPSEKTYFILKKIFNTLGVVDIFCIFFYLIYYPYGLTILLFFLLIFFFRLLSIHILCCVVLLFSNYFFHYSFPYSCLNVFFYFNEQLLQNICFEIYTHFANYLDLIKEMSCELYLNYTKPVACRIYLDEFRLFVAENPTKQQRVLFEQVLLGAESLGLMLEDKLGDRLAGTDSPFSDFVDIDFAPQCTDIIADEFFKFEDEKEQPTYSGDLINSVVAARQSFLATAFEDLCNDDPNGMSNFYKKPTFFTPIGTLNYSRSLYDEITFDNSTFNTKSNILVQTSRYTNYFCNEFEMPLVKYLKTPYFSFTYYTPIGTFTKNFDYFVLFSFFVLGLGLTNFFFFFKLFQIFRDCVQMFFFRRIRPSKNLRFFIFQLIWWQKSLVKFLVAVFKNFFILYFSLVVVFCQFMHHQADLIRCKHSHFISDEAGVLFFYTRKARFRFSNLDVNVQPVGIDPYYFVPTFREAGEDRGFYLALLESYLEDFFRVLRRPLLREDYLNIKDYLLTWRTKPEDRWFEFTWTDNTGAPAVKLLESENVLFSFRLNYAILSLMFLDFDHYYQLKLSPTIKNFYYAHTSARSHQLMPLLLYTRSPKKLRKVSSSFGSKKLLKWLFADLFIFDYRISYYSVNWFLDVLIEQSQFSKFAKPLRVYYLKFFFKRIFHISRIVKKFNTFLSKF